MLRSWIAAECLRTLARFCLLVTISMSSRAIAAEEPAQVVPLIEMPAKVVEKIEEAIRNYPSQGRDPSNFRQRQARTNAAQALEKLAQPAYDEQTLAQDFEYIATKLDLSVADLQALMAGPKKTYKDYKNNMGMIDLGTRVLRSLGVQRAIIR